MLSETLENGLSAYRIGPKLRELRKGKKLGLAQLATHSGLSTALLSKIERGNIFPTLPTLMRIAMVFGVGIEHFFVEPEKRAVAVTRRKDRLQLPGDPGQVKPSFLFESLNFPVPNRKFEAYCAEFPIGRDATEPHCHDGAELVYVLAGQLELTIDGDAFELDEGDAIYFDPAARHSYRCRGRRNCRALVAVAPLG
jgi:transcriptional regulator with XRE-family HTH domain